jgi:peptide deformylase
VSTAFFHLTSVAFGLYLGIFAATRPAAVIYGSLGAIPVFLLWLYWSWVSVLLGVEVAAVNENYANLFEAEVSSAFEEEHGAHGPGLEAALVAAAVIADEFLAGRPAPNDATIAHRTGLPPRSARSVELIPWKETCLSVPEFDVEVDRAKHITVEWKTPDGQPRRADFHEFEAVIVQHELDHLVGTILLDKVSAFRRGRYLMRAKKAQREPVKA